MGPTNSFRREAGRGGLSIGSGFPWVRLDGEDAEVNHVGVVGPDQDGGDHEDRQQFKCRSTAD